MPHISVKLRPGRSEVQKQALADTLARVAAECLDVPFDRLSVAVHEVDPSDWKASVYDVEIGPNLDQLYKKPAYRL
jgi:4-oxalocrotonate tautomerase